MNDKILDFFKQNPTVALTIVSGYSYLCVFSYEQGYCSYYNVPSTYIDVQIVNILKFLTIISIIFGSQAFMINQALQMQLKFFYFIEPVKLFIELNALSMMMFLLLNAIFRLPPDTLIVSMLGVIFLSLLHYLFRMKLLIRINRIAKKHDGNYFQKNAKWIKNKLLHRLQEFSDKKRGSKASWVAYMITLSFVIPLFCTMIGNGEASRQYSVEVLKHRKNFFVVKRYNENIILKNFKDKPFTVGDSLLVLRIGPANPIETFTLNREIVDPPNIVNWDHLKRMISQKFNSLFVNNRSK